MRATIAESLALWTVCDTSQLLLKVLIHSTTALQECLKTKHGGQIILSTWVQLTSAAAAAAPLASSGLVLPSPAPPSVLPGVLEVIFLGTGADCG